MVALGELLPGQVPPAQEEGGHVVAGSEQQNGSEETGTSGTGNVASSAEIGMSGAGGAANGGSGVGAD